MTTTETAKVMAILKVAYPRYYANISKDDAIAAVNLWSGMFKDDEAELVFAAVKSFIATDTKGFPPHIGAIKEQMRKLACGEDGEMTETEAWELVRSASANSIYNAESEFSKLPATIQRVLGSASVLREYAITDAETLNSVVASNFQRSYRARAEHVREWMKLPSDIQRLCGGNTAIKRIERGYDEHLLPPMEDVHSMEDARQAEAQDPRYSVPPPDFFQQVRERCLQASAEMERQKAERLKSLYGELKQ